MQREKRQATVTFLSKHPSLKKKFCPCVEHTITATESGTRPTFTSVFGATEGLNTSTLVSMLSNMEMATLRGASRNINNCSVCAARERWLSSACFEYNSFLRLEEMDQRKVRHVSQLNHSLQLGVLPARLTHLAFGDSFNYRILQGTLPPCLWEIL